jgi:hypothetical protein
MGVRLGKDILDCIIKEGENWTEKKIIRGPGNQRQEEMVVFFENNEIKVKELQDEHLLRAGYWAC